MCKFQSRTAIIATTATDIQQIWQKLVEIEVINLKIKKELTKRGENEEEELSGLQKTITLRRDQINTNRRKKKFKQIYGPILCMGFNCVKVTELYKETVYFLPLIPRNFWYSFDRPRKDEKLSWSWRHPVVLNSGPLDWKSSALSTRPFLHEESNHIKKGMTY